MHSNNERAASAIHLGLVHRGTEWAAALSQLYDAQVGLCVAQLIFGSLNLAGLSGCFMRSAPLAIGGTEGPSDGWECQLDLAPP